MDYLKKKMIQKKEKNSLLTQKTEEKSKKSFSPLDVKKETTENKIIIQNNNISNEVIKMICNIIYAIRKIKLTH